MKTIYILLLFFTSKIYSQPFLPKDEFKFDDCEIEADNKRISNYKFEQYTNALKKLKQPSLLESNINYPIYRFLQLSDYVPLKVITIHFTETPYIEWSTGEYLDINKDGKIGDYENTSLLTKNERIKYDSLVNGFGVGLYLNKVFDKPVFIEEDEVFEIINREKEFEMTYKEAFQDVLSDLGFWEDESMYSCSTEFMVLHGYDWLFEARVDGKYKFLCRKVPDHNKYYLLGNFFLNLTSIINK